MEKEIIKFIGKNPGPTNMVVVGNHGNEKCGILALEKLIPTFKVDFGTVIFIIGNINACVENIRFTECNLNRMFKDENMLSEKEKISYEYFRAKYIKMYLDKADAALDIHSSSVPDSVPFAICEKNAFEIAKNLPSIQAIVYGFTDTNPGGIYSYVNSRNKTGIAIECGYHNDPKTEIVAYESIIAFLIQQGNLKRESKSLKRSSKEFFEAYQIYKVRSKDFALCKKWKDFEELTQGTHIATDGQAIIYAPEESFVLFAQTKILNIGDEAFVLCRKNK